MGQVLRRMGEDWGRRQGEMEGKASGSELRKGTSKDDPEKSQRPQRWSCPDP